MTTAVPAQAPASPFSGLISVAMQRYGGIPLWILVWGWVGLVFLPMINTAMQAFSRGWFTGLLPQEWTFEFVVRTQLELDMANKLANSVIIAFLVVVISIAIALPAAYGLARFNFRGKAVLSIFLLIPILLPPLTYGISIAQIMIAIGLDNTHLGIALAQAVDVTPFVLLMLRGVITGIPVALEEQAETLGANRIQVFRRVILPMILPGLASAVAWAVAKSFSEVPLTILVFGANTQTLATTLFSNFDSSTSSPSRDAALVLWLFLPSAILLIATMRFMKAETITIKG
ncbi:MAG: ABC transporter permease subunit [Pseudomonadota bacterium]